MGKHLIDIAAPRFLSISGLGFGDCGKGLFTDYFCRKHSAHTVVRFNGGAQAGHNVVLSDGTHHTFSQFGSGTFCPGTYTVLMHPVIVHPTALLVENEALRSKGITDALSRLMIDERCRIITPFHQAAGRIREIMRGNLAHGSCGVGVGETVSYSINYPDEALVYGDLAHRDRVREKCNIIRRRILDDLASAENIKDPRIYNEFTIFADEGIADIWIARIAPLVQSVIPSSASSINERLHRSGPVIFEGAQGVLLDEGRGFHPHTTWSSTHADALDILADECELPERIVHYGVIRSYMTRHGKGPFPTYDPRLNHLAEAHNSSEGWQGDFRRGHPDGVLFRYAVSCAGNVSGILLSHCDVFSGGAELSWCAEYETENRGLMRDIQRVPENDFAAREQLTALLSKVRPVYERGVLRSADDIAVEYSGASKLPILFRSFGPIAGSVQEF